jgi:hypothetical protein
MWEAGMALVFLRDEEALQQKVSTMPAPTITSGA